MEIKSRYIIGIVVLIAIGLVVTGYLYAPSEAVEEKPYTQEYIGVIVGECNCILNDSINISGAYAGGISGRFFGKINYQGTESYANLTIRNGTFDGFLRGTYQNQTFIGTINGRSRAFLDGTVIEKVKKGYSIPPTFWYYAGGLIILIVSYQIGLIDAILDRFLGGDRIRQGGFITEPDNEIFEKLKEYLHNLTGEHVAEIRDIIHDPPTRTTKVIFYVVLTNTKLKRITYMGKDRFHLPVRIHEDDYQQDKTEQIKKNLWREQQQKFMDNYEARERARAEFERRGRPPKQPQNPQEQGEGYL